MPNKRSYLFKSLLFVFAILVLVSNIQGLLQQDRQQKFPTLTVDSDHLFHEYLTLESNPIVVDDTTLSTATLIISFGLTDQLHSRLWQYYTADTLVNYVAYPLQGNIAEGLRATFIVQSRLATCLTHRLRLPSSYRLRDLAFAFALGCVWDVGVLLLFRGEVEGISAAIALCAGDSVFCFLEY